MPLNKQVILITGAGGGLGAAAALALAKNGAQVILLDNKIPKLEAVYDKIIDAGAPDPVMYPFDLAGATENDFHELAQRIEDRYGALQGLLHSAVEFSGFIPLAQFGTKEWGHALNVNVNGPFLLTRVLLPILQKSEHASVVFTSDSSARNSPAYSGAYGVSKCAVESFAHILAEEIEAGGKLRINVLVPGPVDSPLRKKAYPGVDNSKLPTMDSLAPVYLYLFGSASIGVNGQIVDARTFHL